jgi:hypothetical protein
VSKNVLDSGFREAMLGLTVKRAREESQTKIKTRGRKRLLVEFGIDALLDNLVN